jgi:hypothetical protein
MIGLAAVVLVWAIIAALLAYSPTPAVTISPAPDLHN